MLRKIGVFIKDLFRKIWSFINEKNYNGLLVIITFCGVIYVVFEFKELKRQNDINEKRIMQDIGASLRIIKSEESNLIFSQQDRSSYIIKRKIKYKNSGENVLYLITYLPFYSNNQLDFRAKSLADYITQVNISPLIFPENAPISFSFPFYPGDIEEIPFTWPDMKSAKDYYLYSVLFFRNQYDSLYHMISLITSHYEKPYVLGMGQSLTPIHSLKYFSYSQDDEKYLIEKVKPNKVGVWTRTQKPYILTDY